MSLHPRDDYNDDLYWAGIEAEQEWADRWCSAWDRLEAIGVVGPEDQNMPLSELERIAAQLGSCGMTRMCPTCFGLGYVYLFRGNYGSPVLHGRCAGTGRVKVLHD